MIAKPRWMKAALAQSQKPLPALPFARSVSLKTAA